MLPWRETNRSHSRIRLSNGVFFFVVVSVAVVTYTFSTAAAQATNNLSYILTELAPMLFQPGHSHAGTGGYERLVLEPLRGGLVKNDLLKLSNQAERSSAWLDWPANVFERRPPSKTKISSLILAWLWRPFCKIFLIC